MSSNFDIAYKATREGLGSSDFLDNDGWGQIIKNARLLVGVNHLDANKASAASDLRSKIINSAVKEINEANVLFKAAGEKLSGTCVLIDASFAKRLGALKLLRHTYFLKKYGGHKIWVLSLPDSFTD